MASIPASSARLRSTSIAAGLSLRSRLESIVLVDRAEQTAAHVDERRLRLGTLVDQQPARIGLVRAASTGGG